jgi:predicted O-methyltransferase YrrM
MTESGFLQDCFARIDTIHGWFQPSAALLFMAYQQVIAPTVSPGHVLEIGVHHGRSAIAVAALRGPGKQFYAIDLFDELQEKNISGSGLGNRATFLRNMKAFFGDIAFVRPITAASADLHPGDLGGGFTFCHIDGGHSAKETYHDLDLCCRISAPGGLIALDDYFHAGFPGVSEGAVRFMIDHSDELVPLAVGYNKVIFQRAPVASDANAKLSATFPQLPKTGITFWERPAFLFHENLVPFIDLSASTPQRLVTRRRSVSALIEPQLSVPLTAEPHGMLRLPVRVVNRSDLTFADGARPFGLSYHVLSEDGTMVRHDNPRTAFTAPLAPGAEQLLDLSLVAPELPGRYRLEVDIVWEHVMWLKDGGNPTAMVEMVVKSG